MRLIREEMRNHKFTQLALFLYEMEEQFIQVFRVEIQNKCDLLDDDRSRELGELGDRIAVELYDYLRHQTKDEVRQIRIQDARNPREDAIDNLCNEIHMLRYRELELFTTRVRETTVERIMALTEDIVQDVWFV